MGFRIHRGIFQKLNAERTAYENTFKIDDDGRIKEVDAEGNVTSGYLKIGEQASDADTVDGLHSGSFLRSDANDTATGKITFTNDLKVDNARILITNSSATGGGNFDPTVLAYTAREQGYGRAQLLLASGYSDITIGSSQSNNNHGSTLTFATVNPSNGADYKKFVIGQGNWGSRAGFLDFGYDSGNESKNPHSYINSTDVVFTIDADNNRVGVNNMNPGRTLDVSGDIYASSWVRVGGSQGLYFQTYGGGWHMTDTTWIRAYNDKSVYTGGSIQAGGYIRANGDGYKVDNTIVINSAGKFVGNIDNSETKSDYFIQEAHGNPRNNLGSPTVTEMSLFNEQFNNKTAFYDPSKITVWQQPTDGAPWEDITSNYGDTTIRRFIAGYDTSGNVYIPNGVFKFRIEVSAVSYVFLNALYMYWSSDSHSTKVHVWKRRVSDSRWFQHTSSNTNVSSWPGHLYLPFSTIPFLPGPHTSTGHYDIVRFEFIPNWSGHATYGDRNINLNKMQIWGGYPAGTRFPYTVNEYGDITARRNLLGTTIYENGTQLSSKYLGVSAKAADANLLDGINSTSFLRSDAADTASSKITFTAAESIELSGIRGRAVGSQTGDFIHLYERVNIGYPNGWGGQAAPSYGLSTHGGAQFNVGNVSNAPFTFNGSTIWHAGNDGSGSGLDADTVDGYHASRLFRIDSSTSRGPDFDTLMPSSNETYFKEVHAINEGTNFPSGAYTYGVVQSTYMSSMKLQWYVPHTASRGNAGTTDSIYFRTNWGGSNWYGWKYLIHSGNIGEQSVNYATTAGTANAVTWANVSGKPSTFTPSSHNHSKITENSTISFGQGSLQWTDLSGNGGDGLNGNTPGNPFNDWHHHIIMNHSNSNGYYVDVAYSFHHDRVHFRRKAGSDPQSWREFWHTGNLSTTKVSNWDTAYGWGNHASAGYASAGFLTNSAGAKLEIQNGTDGGTDKGIYMWQTSDPNWVIYMAQAGAGKSAAGGNAVEGLDGATAHAIRFRVNKNSSQAGFIWENSSEEALMQLNGGTKNLYVAARIYTGGGNSGQWDTAVAWGNHADAGYLTSVPNLDASKITSGTLGTARIPNLAASKITSGTFANARISQSSVTQHQGALSIAASQVTGLPAQTPPINATVEGGEASTLASIHFSPGEGAATFTLADGQTFRLAFAR
jgi:hypothetical protein